jgi:hypothetical protein
MWKLWGSVILGNVYAQAINFTFGAAGDYWTQAAFQATVTEVQRAKVDFHLVLGDMAYDSSGTLLPTPEAWWCQQWRDRNITELIIVSGNHDAGESCCGDLNLYLQACPRSLPINGTFGVRYFMDYPPVNPLARFVFVTAGVRGLYASWDNYAVGGVGYLWVQSVLDDARAKNITWLIVSMHKNYISVLEKGNELGTDLMPLLFAKKVDLILQGHEHGYERSKQLTCATAGSFVPACVADSDDNFTKGNGTVIVVLGTGGYALRTVNPNDVEWGYFQTADIVTYGFGHFFVSPERLNYHFQRSYGGQNNDSFVIIQPTLTPPTPSSAPTNSVLPTPAPTNSVLPTPAPSNAFKAERGSFPEYYLAPVIGGVSALVVAIALSAVVVYKLKRRKHRTVMVQMESVQHH